MNKAYIVQCTSFGDSSKGAIVDLIASQITKSHKSPPPVIRHSGGPQCGHNVEANNLHHCFQMWGSGSFNGSDTYLLQNVLINPFNIERERRKLAETTGIGQNTDFWQKKMFIHEDCLVITPFHIALNRLQELKNKHGSVGSGCWATISHSQEFPNTAIYARQLKDAHLIELKLVLLAGSIIDKYREDLESYIASYTTDKKDEFIEYLLLCDHDKLMTLIKIYTSFCQSYQILSDSDIKSRLSSINQTAPLIFEGNQGTLLDPDFGFAPHTTANSSTAKHAEEFCGELGISRDNYHIIGATRPYMTRHGNGPFPSYDPDFHKNIGVLEGERNKFGQWQGDFRVGRFDLDLLQESLAYQPVDSLFVSCLDNDPYSHYFDSNYCRSYPFDSKNNTINKAAEIAGMLNTNLCGFSFGPDRAAKYIKL